MKLINYLFRPYVVARALQTENTQLKKEIIELKDTNDSLWDMLDEIKQSEQEAAIYQNLPNSEPAGEA